MDAYASDGALQWGRNFAVAETIYPVVIPVENDLLQWGRNFAVAETTGRASR